MNRILGRAAAAIALCVAMAFAYVMPAAAMVSSPWMGLYVSGTYMATYHANTYQALRSDGSGWQVADFTII